ncbi:uncharacterized protein LOC123317851 [Coccinella septempunctata]|uniref:uncharacterized protein LOC123317851 n=1 Tax=Coccinella septempunctata TaxID=41139 RepID=UPI001D07AF6F|nr:uncharacterized protein LOC123317851 [Coccinella septempunctata]
MSYLNSNSTITSASLSQDCSAYIPDLSGSMDFSANTINISNDVENPTTDTSTDFEKSLLVNKPGHSAPDDNNMYVNTVESGRKKDHCIFCRTEQAKLSQHLIRKHKNEEKIREILSHEIGSKRRKELFAAIRKNGQFFFNTSEMVNTGERKVARRPSAKYNKKPVDFVSCPSCCGDYAKSAFRRHFQRCNKSGIKNKRNNLIKSRQIVGRIHRSASDILRKSVFPTLTEDSKEIRYDELVILFGNKLCQKYKDPHFYDMIRQKLRQLGRFLIEIKKINDDVDYLFDVYYPKNYDSAITAVQNLAGMNE